MFDANLLFFEEETLDASDDSAPIEIQKTPVAGVPVEVVVTDVSGTDPTLDIVVEESDNGSDWNAVAVFPQITTTGRWGRLVQSKAKYLRLAATLGGTSPEFTVTAGIVTGFQRDMGA